ncbi:hypothetical protein [Blastococcus saxobsidens]|uniref:Uncharacterized protein n=1 Tax=Blastococcus saxobsidens (strain DD2) TaxID=1146883 RepID=H6RRY5_BLASD|nr:hypothetical protein [Blastococcus saxobsidens]CCG02979.1 protein of unknown function [Blastococcus saxobsidens DD2]
MSVFDRFRKPAPGVGREQAGAVDDLAAEAPTAPPAVPTSWLAVPTLAEAGAQRPVAGTSFHQGLLADTDRQLRSQSPVADLVTVQLAVVESGDYAGAVGVYLAGRRAGSVPAGRVEAYRPVVAALTEQGLPATCRAAIVGGGGVLSFDLFGGDETRDGDGARNFGLALLQPAQPAAAGPDAPFLPPHTGSRVSVLGPARWDAAMPSRAKRFVHRRVGVLSTDGVLSLDGDAVGRVESAAEVLPPLLAAHAAGFPLTCAVRIIREPDRPLRVAVDVPLSFQS